MINNNAEDKVNIYLSWAKKILVNYEENYAKLCMEDICEIKLNSEDKEFIFKDNDFEKTQNYLMQKLNDILKIYQSETDYTITICALTELQYQEKRTESNLEIETSNLLEDNVNYLITEYSDFSSNDLLTRSINLYNLATRKKLILKFLPYLKFNNPDTNKISLSKTEIINLGNCFNVLAYILFIKAKTHLIVSNMTNNPPENTKKEIDDTYSKYELSLSNLCSK